MPTASTTTTTNNNNTPVTSTSTTANSTAAATASRVPNGVCGLARSRSHGQRPRAGSSPAVMADALVKRADGDAERPAVQPQDCEAAPAGDDAGGAASAASGDLPPGWLQCYTAEGYIYYVSPLTQLSVWERPTVAAIGDLGEEAGVKPEGAAVAPVAGEEDGGPSAGKARAFFLFDPVRLAICLPFLHNTALTTQTHVFILRLSLW